MKTNIIFLFTGVCVAIILVVVAIARTRLGGVASGAVSLLTVRPRLTWSLFVGLIGVAFFCSTYTPGLKVGEIGSWSWDHAIPLLSFFAIIFILIWIWAARMGVATTRTLRIAFATIVVLLFLVAPLEERFRGVFNPHDKTTTGLPNGAPTSALPQDAPNLTWAWHTPMADWPKVPVPARGDSVHVPSVLGGHIVWGRGFTVHYVYSDGHECTIGDTGQSCGDGDIVAGYAHNDGDIPLLASYAYARADEK